MVQPRVWSRGRVGIAGAVAWIVAASATHALATNTVRTGGTVGSGTLSAKLLAGRVSASTPSRQSLLICDPDRPFIEITSVFYDRDYAQAQGVEPRVTVTDIDPGPGYEILRALVEIEVFGQDVSQRPLATGRKPGPDQLVAAGGNIAYQELDAFLVNPLGRETGLVQMQANRLKDDAGTTGVDESATGRIAAPSGFTLVDSDGITTGPDSVDTHAWSFQARDPLFNDAAVEYAHLATEDEGALQDMIIGQDANGLYFVQARDIVPAFVTAPEPGATALLAMAAAGFALRRRRRPG